MTRRIYLAEDEGNLIEQAKQELEMIYDQYKVEVKDKLGRFRTTQEFGRRYDFIQVDLPRSREGAYWSSLGIEAEDLVVLDLNFKNYVNPETKVRTPLSFSGKEVLRTLEQGKKKGSLAGLEQVLVATSMKAEVDPKHVSPDLAFVEGFKVYGLEKAVDQTGRIIDYGRSLAYMIHQIYEGAAGRVGDKIVLPLNQEWK